MKRSLLKVVSFLFLFIAILTGYSSAQYQYPQYQYQQYPQQYQQFQYQQYQQMDQDAQLNMQDQMMLQQLSMKGTVDYRYGQFLTRISQRFNQAGPTIYPNYNSKNVQYVVIAGVFGFNAMTLSRTIIIDSIQMDGFRRVAEGMAYYGGLNNQYCYALIQKLVQLSAIVNSGQRVPANYNNLENPFALPVIGSLNGAQQQTANILWEELVAANLAHEGSHAFREHTKHKLLKQRELWMQYGGRAVNQQQLSAQIAQYMGSTYSKATEFEADSYGVMLLKASGYPLRGFINWMKIAEIFERIAGTPQDPSVRTHPTSAQRIQNAQNVWARY